VAFDTSSCAIEQYTGLPVCLIGESDVQLLHASISQVVAYMATHHIPRDEGDLPYEYRDYIPDRVSGNDVAALSRIAAAAALRGIDLPPVLAPLYLGADAPVTQADVYYVAENAYAIAVVLGPLLSAMREADEVPCKAFPWGWLVAALTGGLLLGIALASAASDDPDRERRERERERRKEGRAS